MIVSGGRWDYRDCSEFSGGNRILSDHLTVRGFRVRHPINESSEEEHDFHPNARVNEEAVRYPGLV